MLTFLRSPICILCFAAALFYGFQAQAAPPIAANAAELAKEFARPPESAKPWVLWFWINGNISKEGITNDLEAYQEVGVGGVLWMEVSGPHWPPMGEVEAYTPEWNEAMQWTISECARLGLKFGMTIDFGYGCGGPHITPENSMQKLYWSETEVTGGQEVALKIPRPEISKELTHLRIAEDEELRPEVRRMIEEVDSYRDVALLALPLPASEKGRAYRIPHLDIKQGLDSTVRPGDKAKNSLPFSPDAVIPLEKVINLTDKMDTQGKVTWDAPEGDWLILRLGHASNYTVTRPNPIRAVGLEADRLSPAGIGAHYEAFLKPIIEGAGEHVGKTFVIGHIDSWEAGHQNWTAAFPREFEERRGYDLRRWLPAMTGRVIEGREESNRFLDDVARTASDLLQDNFNRQLVKRLHGDGLLFSHESYGTVRVDNVAWAALADIPMSEFWTRGKTLFPNITGYAAGRKTATSICNTYGKPIHGAEAFTADRGWRDHPWTLKAIGDKAFAEGINRMVLHCGAHQPYENAVPGISHRKWGNHFTRFNTWWFHSQGWMDYLSRCQYLLQQGTRVADALYWPGELISPEYEHFRNPFLRLPQGYDYDVATNEVFFGLKVRDGKVVAPSGVRYPYLILPRTNCMSPKALYKIEELADAGARIIAGPKPVKALSLHNHAQEDAEVVRLGNGLWTSGKVITGKHIPKVFTDDGLVPDVAGENLFTVHRRLKQLDVYFVANALDQPVEQEVRFRVTDAFPELWDPETGQTRPLPDFSAQDGVTILPLRFDPMDSYFVVFRDKAPEPGTAANFPNIEPLREIEGPWQVTFDPEWGGPKKPVVFEKLIDWAKHPEQGIHWYSGTATYRRALTLNPGEMPQGEERLLLDLGQVEVIARVWLNGSECGIAWKPPYEVDITGAAKAGENHLEIEVVNLWINRMIGDEHFPEDSTWINAETLAGWPEWMLKKEPRRSGRYTFTTVKHYDAAPLIYQIPEYITKDSELFPSGLMGPVFLKTSKEGSQD